MIKKFKSAEQINPVVFSSTLRDVARCIYPNSQSAVVIGIKGVGKTSFLSYIYANGLESLAQKRPTYVYVDASRFAIEKEYSAGFWAEVWRLTKLQLGQSDREDISPDAFLQLRNIAETNKKLIVILIDNFDSYLSFAENADLRKFRQITSSASTKNLFFIATSSEDISKVILRNKKLDIFESPSNFLTYYLLPMTCEGTKAFIKDFKFNFSKNELNFLFEMSGGHPELVKIIAEYINSKRSRKNIPLDKNRIEKITNELLIDERVILLCMSIYERLMRSQKHVMDKLLSGPFEGLIEVIDSMVQRMIDQLGVIQKVNTTLTIKVFSRLFYLVLRERFNERPIIETSSKEIVNFEEVINISMGSHSNIEHDPKKRAVKIDGKPITLTKLESNLLAYLLSRRNELCSKEELLLNVWSPNRSTVVVERGINRLRDKIEREPAIPQRLITVKGKGYILKTHTVSLS